MDPVSYVQSMKLKFPSIESENSLFPDETPVSKELMDGQDQAKAVGGSIMALTHNLTGQNKQDVVNGTLFAQLGADDKVDREKEPDQWYKEYVAILQSIGFVVQKYELLRYESTEKSYRVGDVALEKLKPSSSSGGLAVMRSAIDSLGKLPDWDRSLIMFTNFSSRTKQGNFQLGVAYVDDESGDVIMSLGAFAFTLLIEHTSRFLWYTWKSGYIDLFTGCQRVLLDEEAYGKVRQDIIDKLGVFADTFVGDIPI